MTAGRLSRDELARIEANAEWLTEDSFAVDGWPQVLAHLRVVEAERDDLAEIVDDLAACSGNEDSRDWWETIESLEARARAARTSEDR